MERFRTRLCLVLAVAIAGVVVLAGLAYGAPASRPHAAWIMKDAYEPADNATATAPDVLDAPTPPDPFHTISGVPTNPLDPPLADEDWTTFDVTSTGSPVLIETSFAGGWYLPDIEVFATSPASTNGLVSVPVPGIRWGGIGGMSSILFRAPNPGRYYVRNTSDFPSSAGGAYRLLERRALARRIAGADRFATAAAVSHKMWPLADEDFSAFLSASGAHPVASPAGVILATGRGFADALAASAWGGMGDLPQDRMPVLLTEPSHLPTSTAVEIERLASARKLTNERFTVYVVGSSAVVSDAVMDDLQALQGDDWNTGISDIVRVAGNSRWETAAKIAQQEASSTTGIGDTVFIVNGFSFADALSAGPVAAHTQAPILLVDRTLVPTATSNFLLAHNGEIKHAIVVGSGSVVATSVMTKLAAPPYSLGTTRVFGSDRWRTSWAIAYWGVVNAGMNPTGQIVVTGANYPDGLAAGGLSAFSGTPVLLTPGTQLSSAVTSFSAEFGLHVPSYIVGGASVVTTSTERDFNNLWTH